MRFPNRAPASRTLPSWDRAPVCRAEADCLGGSQRMVVLSKNASVKASSGRSFGIGLAHGSGWGICDMQSLRS